MIVSVISTTLFSALWTVAWGNGLLDRVQSDMEWNKGRRPAKAPVTEGGSSVLGTPVYTESKTGCRGLKDHSN